MSVKRRARSVGIENVVFVEFSEPSEPVGRWEHINQSHARLCTALADLGATMEQTRQLVRRSRALMSPDAYPRTLLEDALCGSVLEPDNGE
jgi:hypothetical protein